MAEEVAELGDVTLGGRVCGDHPNALAAGHLSHFAVQQHERLWTEQARGIEQMGGIVVGHNHVVDDVALRGETSLYNLAGPT